MKYRYCPFIAYLLLLSGLCFSQEYYYRVKGSAPYYQDPEGRIFGYMTGGEKIHIQSEEMGFPATLVRSRSYTIPAFFMDAYLNGGMFCFNVKDVEPWNAHDLLPVKMLTYDLSSKDRKLYGKDYFIDVLRSGKRETIFEYEPYWNSRKVFIDDCESEYLWYELLSEALSFTQSQFSFLSQVHLEVFGNLLMIIDIKKQVNGYLLTVVENKEWGTLRYISKWLDLGAHSSDTPFDILLVPDGDYVDIYLQNPTRKLTTMVMVDDLFINRFSELIKTGTTSLDGIRWPRRGKGVNLILEGADAISQPSANLSGGVISSPLPGAGANEASGYLGTTARILANLRLRASASRGAAIIVTLSQGTAVTVLEKGPEETIDDLKSRWVRVRTKDGVEGWCFGGYLDPRPVP